MPPMSPSSLSTPPPSSFPSSNAPWASFPLRHRPLLPFRHRSPPFYLLFLFQHPSSTPDTCSLVPPAFRHRLSPSAPPAPRHRPSLASSTPLPSYSVKQDRTKAGPVLPNEGPLFGHVWPNKGHSFDQTEPNRDPPFDLVWPNGAERKGHAGGAEREHVPKSREMILKKREETEGRRAAPRRRKRMV